MFIEEQKAGIDPNYNKKLDWYISAQPKTVILDVLFIIKDMLTTNSEAEPTRKGFYEKLETLRDMNPDFRNDLEQWDWKNIRYIIKAMWRKYRNNVAKKNLKKFENFVELARMHWKMQFKK